MREESESRPAWRRAAGLALVAGAVLGGILVLFGLYLTTVTLGGIETAVNDSLASLDETLALTADGLDTATLTLGEANTTLGALSDTLGSATSAISDTLPTVDTLAGLTGAELPDSIRSTQAALGSAQETARVIDRVLGAISGFGLISSASYNPEVPLNEAIAEVSASLDDLPPALERVDGGLRDASRGLAGTNRDLVVVAAGVGEIAASLRAASGSVDDYRAVVADLQTEVAELRERLPPWFTGLRVGLVLGLIWLAIAQVSLFLQGWGLLRD